MPPSPEPSELDTSMEDMNQSLLEVEQSLNALKARYTQVQRDQQRQAELQQRLKQVKRQLHNQKLPPLKAELKQIKEQLETLEVNLESQLFSWRSLKEPFWQAVRFGGLGIVVGWILKSCAS